MSPKSVRAVGLGVLAVFTAVLVVFAFAHGRGTATSNGISHSESSDNVRSSVSPTSTSATSTPRASLDPSSAGPSSPSEGNGVDEIRALFRSEKPISILVVGDESGAGATGWVHQWAITIAEERPVAYQQWTGPGFAQTEQLGDSSGERVTIRNASINDGSALALVEQADDLVDASPDVVIVNLGGHEQAAAVSETMDTLWTRIGRGALGAVVLQNAHKQGDPQRQLAVVSAMREWTTVTGLPIIDVYGVFLHDSAPLASLLDDGGRLPNAAGAKLWAFTVALTIGP